MYVWQASYLRYIKLISSNIKKSVFTCLTLIEIVLEEIRETPGSTQQGLKCERPRSTVS